MPIKYDRYGVTRNYRLNKPSLSDVFKRFLQAVLLEFFKQLRFNLTNGKNSCSFRHIVSPSSGKVQKYSSTTYELAVFRLVYNVPQTYWLYTYLFRDLCHLQLYKSFIAFVNRMSCEGLICFTNNNRIIKCVKVSSLFYNQCQWGDNSKCKCNIS